MGGASYLITDGASVRRRVPKSNYYVRPTFDNCQHIFKCCGSIFPIYLFYSICYFSLTVFKTFFVFCIFVVVAVVVLCTCVCFQGSSHYNLG